MNFFNLQEGEKIIWEAKPLPGYRWVLSFQWFFMLAAITFVLFMMAIPITILVVGPFWGIILGIIIPILIIVFLSGFFAGMAYNKEYYWVTSDRVIHKMGLIGYSVHSIPLERVSDVIISRSLFEKIFGIASIHIQSLAGQVSHAGGKFGSEGRLNAVEDPEGLQKIIFELVKKNRAEKKLAI